MKHTTETVPCLNGCPNEDIHLLHRFDQYAVCRCDRCSLVFLNPRLSEELIANFYEDQYFTGNNSTGYEDYAGQQTALEKTFARRMKFIQRFTSGGKLLDIGCSLGFFLDVAHKSGFESWGLDCSKYAVEQCQKRFPDRVVQGFLDDKIFAEKSFDVVTMFDVFEHIYDPIAFLKNVHRIVKNDGIVVITTPNKDSLLSKFSGRNWVSYKIPEHVYYYTPDTLRRVVTPLFATAAIRRDGQYASLALISDRLKWINPFVGSSVEAMAKVLGLEKMDLLIDCGGMTAILQPNLVASKSHPISSHSQALPEFVARS